MSRIISKAKGVLGKIQASHSIIVDRHSLEGLSRRSFKTRSSQSKEHSLNCNSELNESKCDAKQNVTSSVKPSIDLSFAQEGPQHDNNAFTADPFLQRCLLRLIPKDIYDTQVHPDLLRFGQRIAPEIWDIGRQCEDEPPYLINHTDAWGKPIANQLITSSAWRQQKRISAQEGLIAIPYERNNLYSRIHQVAKLYMYSPASGLYSCPLAMTDGAAKVLSGLKDRHEDLENAFNHLTSRNPDLFWSSGQWMTEKRGGSDVANGTETFAYGPQEDGSYRLHGYKWFSSATDSDMTLTLARIPNEMGQVTQGTQGISMFFARTRLPKTNESNGIIISKLKNKLGTKQLPTGELLLDGTLARLISENGRGIASISPMLTITRLHNVISSVAAQRKMLNLARDYSIRRTAFGRSLYQHPLHMNTLSRIETDIRGCTVLMLDLARQVGEEEAGNISKEDSLLLRLMMPVAKAYTAKKAVSNISEGIECFGGQGYIEDTGLPGLLRDVQVLPIWEGTTNVMALDTVRAIGKTKGEALDAFHGRISRAVESSTNSSDKDVKEAADKLNKDVKLFTQYCSAVDRLPTDQQERQQLVLREYMFTLAHLYIGTLLLEHAVHNGSSCKKIDFIVLKNWMAQTDMIPVVTNAQRGAYQLYQDEHQEIVFEGYDSSSTVQGKFVR